MEIPVPLVCLALASAIGIQGWILKAIVDIKIELATLKIESTEMKKRTQLIPVAVMLLAFVPLLLIGCATAPGTAKAWGGLLQAPPIVSQETNTVLEPFTSYLVQTNQGGEIVTNTVTVTNLVEKVVTVTNQGPFQIAPGVQAGAETARAFTPFIPAPFNTATELALTAGLGVLGWYARRKNAKALEEAEAAAELARSNQELAQVIAATISGVESATRKDKGASVKTEIKEKAAAAGVLPLLHALVKQNT